MKILITSNFKKHFNTYVDFVDYYLLNYFEKKKIDTVIIPNKIEITKKKLLKQNNINLILLPGGNDVLKKSIFNKNRLKVECEIIKFGIKKKIPIIGICRGMQVLNYFFNGKMKLINNHMRKKHRIFFKKNFFRKKSLIVNSYHSWGIPKKLMSKKFNIIAHDDEYNIEMFEHKKLNILGTMWHPEREKSYNNLNFIINKMIKKSN
jgi:N5-(cytidine 5'-diphosphoramidyl)-L-glutamine hydrolase